MCPLSWTPVSSIWLAKKTIPVSMIANSNAKNTGATSALPFSPNRASATLPGTIGLTTELFAAINTRDYPVIEGSVVVFAVMLLQSAEFRRQLRALVTRPAPGGPR